MKEYRCTRNASYSHHCIGHEDITARQGYYIKANSAKEALEKMFIRFPEEVKEGFTVEEWKTFNVKIVEIRRNDNGDFVEVELDKNSNIPKTNRYEQE